MAKTCPIPTPVARAYGEILSGVEDELMRKIDAALEAAAERARSEIETAGLDLSPPARDYFTAVAHQQMYCMLCGADPRTFAGGRAETAIAVIRNSRNIAAHYWGARIEP